MHTYIHMHTYTHTHTYRCDDDVVSRLLLVDVGLVHHTRDWVVFVPPLVNDRAPRGDYKQGSIRQADDFYVFEYQCVYVCRLRNESRNQMCNAYTHVPYTLTYIQTHTHTYIHAYTRTWGG
jgi:hypothetical protein